MRTLFFGNPAFGHLIPQMPLARAFRDAGCPVAFVSAASTAGLIEPEGFELLGVGPEIPDIVAELTRITGVDPYRDGITTESEAEFFAAIRVELGYRDSLTAARDWKPDLIIAEPWDYIAPMVAAALEVPAVTLAYGPALRPESLAAANSRAQHQHRRLALNVPAARWYLDTCPPSLQLDGWQPPAARLALRPEAYTGGAKAPSVDTGTRTRPRVLVNFGTLFVIPGIITPIVHELLKQDIDIRITLGPSGKADEFDLASDRVEFVGFTPLAQLLSDVDAVLSVGGAGTVIGALAYGLPLVMTPLGADQPLHAERAASAGAGIAFEIGGFTPQTAARAVADVLSQPSYRTAAQRVADEISAMPAPAKIAARLIADLG